MYTALGVLCPGVSPLTALPEPSYLETDSWCPPCPGVSVLSDPQSSAAELHRAHIERERELLILSILPNQPASYLHKDIKETEGEQRGA